jgi:uncharacterized protein (TIGR02246 family)
MSAITPEQVDFLFFEAMNHGDLDAALALHEADARWYQDTGDVLTGHAAIRVALAKFLRFKPRFSADVTAMTDGGQSVAVTRAHWRMEGIGDDGLAFAAAAISLEVVRRQADGTWLFAIVTPGSQ